METLKTYGLIFRQNGLTEGRMVAGSKSGYRTRNEYNKVYFNANVCILNENILEKIWWGDIDISLEGDKLKDIGKLLDETLYVFYEHDARNIEDLEDLNLEQSVWDTTQEVPYITTEYIKQQKEKDRLEAKQSRVARIRYYRTEAQKNKEFKTTELVDNPFDIYTETLEIPFDMIQKEVIKIKNKFKTPRANPKRDEGEVYEKYFKEYGYFTYGIIDKYLTEKFNLNEKQNINPSSVWLSREANKKLRQIDLEIEQLFNPDFKYGDFQRYVTCNYCVPEISFLNRDAINMNSYKDNVLYIRGTTIVRDNWY